MTICIITTGAYTQQLYTAAKQMGDDIQVIHMPSAIDVHYDIQKTAAYILPYVRSYAFVLAADDSFCAAVVSYMAVKLHAPMISRITGVTALGFKRRQYGGAVISTVNTDADTVCATVDVRAFDGYTGDIPVTPIPAPEFTGENTKDIQAVPVSQSLATAKKVIVVGAAVTTPQDIDTIGTIAHYIGADIGATTPVVTAGLLPPHTLVGARGVSISPDIYIGIGVSGAVHHLVGIRGAKTIIAVNIDTNAPLCAIADYVVNADYHDVLQELKKLLA